MPPPRTSPVPAAVIFDFGGVILTSPFEAFARYEADHGLPAGFLRRLNATDPDTNAWARLERSEVDLAGFADLFEAEARGGGQGSTARRCWPCWPASSARQMVEALRRCHERLKTALLTNNFVPPDDPSAEAMADVARPDRWPTCSTSSTSSSSRAGWGCASPTPRSTALVCDELGVEPSEAVFLDDLGRQPQARPGHGHDHDQGRRSRRRPGRAGGRRGLPAAVRTDHTLLSSVAAG